MFGIGLRTAHYDDFLQSNVSGIDFVEAITENFAGRGGKPASVLRAVRDKMAVAFHGVSLSLGGVDPISTSHLLQLRELCDQYEPLWVSEHLSFSTHGGHYSHDLWPLPRTKASVRRVVDRIDYVQSFLQQRILIENVSSYVQYAADDMSEAEFLVAIVESADCDILLDVNNAIVNAFNHQTDAADFIQTLPAQRIRQLHLAGHAHCGTHLFDNHQGPIPESVWDLYRVVLQHAGNVPALIEWDEQVPALQTVISQSDRAREIAREVLQGHAGVAA